MTMYNGFVYLARSDTGHYKIGRSKNPYARIRHFDTIMPVNVEIVHYFPCDDPVRAEREYHAWAGRVGNRVAGEWFELSDGIVSAMCNTTHYLNGRACVNWDIMDNGVFIQECCHDFLERKLRSGAIASPDGNVYRCIVEEDADWYNVFIGAELQDATV